MKYPITTNATGLLFGLALLSTACTRRTEPLPISTNGDSQKALGGTQPGLQRSLNSANGPSLAEHREWLQKLEDDLLDGSVDSSNIDDIEGKLTQFSDSLPVLAAIELSTPITKIVWLLQMESILSGDPTAESLSDGEILLEQVPAALGEATAERYSRRHAESVIAVCKKISLESNSDVESVELAKDILSRLQPDSEPDAAVEELNSKLERMSSELRKTALTVAVKADLAALQSQISTAAQISDIELKHSILGTINQSLYSLRGQLALQGHASELESTSDTRDLIQKHLEEASAALSHREQTELQSARMRYQAWALKEIETLNSLLDKQLIDKELYRLRDNTAKSAEPVVVPWADFPGVRTLFEGTLGVIAGDLQLTGEQQKNVGGVVKANWYEIKFQLIHDVAVKHLLTIEQGLLEPPVVKFYNEAFDKVWNELQEKPALHLSLARKTAEVSKIGLELSRRKR